LIESAHVKYTPGPCVDDSESQMRPHVTDILEMNSYKDADVRQ